VPLPPGITLTRDLAGAQMEDTVLLAVPMQALAGFLQAQAPSLHGLTLVACCKGLDLTTLRGPTALIAEHVMMATPAVLTGPSFAADIARGLPTALTLATPDIIAGVALQGLLSTPTLRIYHSADIIGAELGGALKNVIAIAAGVVIGAGLGDSARAALMTRGFAEMQRIAPRTGGGPGLALRAVGLGRPDPDPARRTCRAISAMARHWGAGEAFDPPRHRGRRRHRTGAGPAGRRAPHRPAGHHDGVGLDRRQDPVAGCRRCPSVPPSETGMIHARCPFLP
jgi:glycerol-3-phosphate dehydrogenase (NAD(P)+)